MKERFFNWVGKNPGLFWGLTIGLAVAILILTIGFWRVLLIAICIGVGVLLGTHPEIRKAIGTFFTDLFSGKKHKG